MIVPTLFPLLFIIIGVMNILFPKAGWYMKYGWQFKNAEPSDAALLMARIGGGIAVAIGLYLFIAFPFR